MNYIFTTKNREKETKRNCNVKEVETGMKILIDKRFDKLQFK